MQYKCFSCKSIFSEPRQHIYKECVGEYWGAPAYETFLEEYCPECGSDNFDEYWGDEEDDEDEEE